MAKLSIIVPIYNVEAYLPRCIESILNQDYTDFELILVDDGSIDQSGEIIDSYAQKDCRIISIHQDNKGVSAARNAGLRIAKGEYIGFVDPDDWIEPEMYSILVGQLQTEGCDISSCSWMDDYENGDESAYESRLATGTMTREAYASHLFDIPITISGSVCSKLFKRDVIGAWFSELFSYCEDNLFVIQCCTNIKKAGYINQPLYHVYSRNNSATRKEAGIVAKGLAARRAIIYVARGISKECEMLAEHSFINQCIAVVKFKGIKPMYKEMAKDEFLTYMRENPFCIVLNVKFSVKQKVYFMYCYLSLICRKGVKY